MKASYKMKMAIKRLEKKYGSFDILFDETNFSNLPIFNRFYSCARLYSYRYRGYIVVSHDGSICYDYSDLS